MTQAERITRRDAEIAAFNELYGAAYAAWLKALPATTDTPWLPVANDNQSEAANDNTSLDEAA